MNTFLKQVCLNTTFFAKCAKKSALEELFEDEDRELLQATTSKSCAISKAEQAHKEIEIYKRSTFSLIRTRPCSLVVGEAGQSSHIVCTFKHIPVCAGLIDTI